MPASRGSADGNKATFACSDCDKSFSRREYVERHRRLKHLGERPFECEECGHAFARSDLLRRHKKTCTPESVTSEGPGSGSAPLVAPVVHPQPALFGGQSYPTDFGPLASTSAGSLESSYSVSPSTTSPSSIPVLSPAGSSSDGTLANSPQTPYSTESNSNQTQDQLFGGLTSKRDGHGVFTQDEILASEVLEDLLRSPPDSRHYTPTLGPTLSNVSNNIIASTSVFTSSSAASTTLAPATTMNMNMMQWHGARTTSPGNNISTSVMDDSGMSSWDVFAHPHQSSNALSGDDSQETIGGEMSLANFGDYDPFSGIEFSPEANALADYFNKGGVGGISALDLGFPTEPSMWPNHMYAPSPSFMHDHDEKKFFLPSQKFCLGYLYPWHVPPLKTLSRFASTAASSFLPSVPVVHPGTLCLSEMPTHTAFALTVTGAAYDAEGESFSNEMLVEKRVFLVRGFANGEYKLEDKFASLQSMLLYQLLGLFHKDESHRKLSHTFHAALVMMMKSLDLPSLVQEGQGSFPTRELYGAELDAAWKHWVKVETYRRVAFIVYLSDLETATRFNESPLLPFAELAIDLPGSDALWSATTPTQWLNLYLASSNPRPISFIDAIRALLSPTVPAPYSADALLLAELPRLSSFPLLILSRTLSFLQMKTETALQEVDPFRNLLGGFGIFEKREAENREVLQRIVRGRETLVRLPGGVKRGGGEKWFEGVVPKPSFATKQQPNTMGGQSMDELFAALDEDDAFNDQTRLPRNYTPTKDATTHFDRINRILTEDFPEYVNPNIVV